MFSVPLSLTHYILVEEERHIQWLSFKENKGRHACSFFSPFSWEHMHLSLYTEYICHQLSDIPSLRSSVAYDLGSLVDCLIELCALKGGVLILSALLFCPIVHCRQWSQNRGGREVSIHCFSTSLESPYTIQLLLICNGLWDFFWTEHLSPKVFRHLEAKIWLLSKWK